MHRVILLTLLGLMLSCSPNSVYRELQRTENYHWLAEDVKEFSLPIEDPTAYYQLRLLLRHIDGYPFQTLKLELQSANSEAWPLKQQYEVSLLNEKGGYLGEVAGDFWDYDLVLEDSIRFDAKGEYLLRLRHVMPAEHLPFIDAVGLRLLQLN